jgi:type IVB pilus formation R64 PilN family outer membrane protein
MWIRVRVFAIVSALVACTACTGLSEKVDGRFQDTDARTTRLLKDVGRTDNSENAATPVVHKSGIWIGKNVIKLEQQVTLPPIFYEPATFDRTVYSLAELAERITLRSGIPTKVTPDAAAAAARTLQPVSTPGNATGSGAAQVVAVPAGAASSNTGTNTQNNPVRIVYGNGNFKGLLDTASARFGVFWKYANGAVQFFYTETRTFQISAIPGESALVATVASGATSGDTGSGGGGGGVNTNNGQNTAVKSQLSVYGSIEKAIGAMLSPYGKVVASPATGTVTVVDTPDTLVQVAKLVESENKTLSRQVMINVTVLAVNLTELDNVGINWSLVYGDLSRKYGVTNTLFASDKNSTSFSAAILSTSSSSLAGSSLVVDALSSQGKVRRETSASVVTLNNQPVPVQVAKQSSYLKSSTTTITANVGTTTTLTPGTVVSGFNMTILPHVLNNGTVMLQFSTDISALRGFRTVTSSSSSIETPEIDTRNFLQRVAMKSNETLIISGFEQTDDNLDRQGVTNPGNFLLGGGYKAQANKEIIVILITPIAMSGY